MGFFFCFFFTDSVFSKDKIKKELIRPKKGLSAVPEIHIVPTRVINWLRYRQKHWIPPLVLRRRNEVSSRKHPSLPKEDHELITNPVGARADRADAGVQVTTVTENFFTLTGFS